MTTAVSNSVLTEMRAKNASVSAITGFIYRLEAAQNIARLAREELATHGATTRYFALLDAARDEAHGATL